MRTAPVDSTILSNTREVPPPSFNWWTRVILPVGVLCAFAAIFAGSVAASFATVVEVEALSVVERPAMLRKETVSDSPSGSVIVQAAGWIEPDPFVVYATALTNGSIRELLFLEGDEVRKDQVLARMVDDDSILALKRAEAEARAAEEEWEANIESRRDADVAAASYQQHLASLELARAELDVQKALHAEAERIFKRRENLIGNDTISREEHDAALASAEAQRARVKVVESRIDELTAGLARMKAEQVAAQQSLELRTEEKKKLDLARIALDEAKLRVRRQEIVSPVDGVIMRRLAGPGSVVMTDSDDPMMSRVAEIYDPEKLQVRVDVPLADAAKIGVGQPAKVVIEVLPDQTFEGVVSRITNFADIQKNTLEVKVQLLNPAPELKPEMLARVRFFALSGSGESNTAATPGGTSVYTFAKTIQNGKAWVVTEFDGEEGIVQQRSVNTTGAESDGWLEIESGLKPGDMVVTSDVSSLKPSQRVRVTGQGGI